VMDKEGGKPLGKGRSSFFPAVFGRSSVL
jgi:hypothetical protein